MKRSALVLALALLAALPLAAAADGGAPPDSQIISEVMSVLRGRYFPGKTADKWQRCSADVAALVTGKTQTLSCFDAFTRYYPEADWQAKMDAASGRGIGIGVELQTACGAQNDCDVLLDPLPGSPAEKAGVQKGDVMVRVEQDGAMRDVTDEWQVASALKGAEGTSVSFEVLRRGELQPRMTAERKSFSQGVLSVRQIGDVCHARLSSFYPENSGHYLEQAIIEVCGEDVALLALDLRGNGGGYTDNAVRLLVGMTKRDETVLMTEFERGKVLPRTVENPFGCDPYCGQFRDPETKELIEKGRLARAHKVVLINRGSASATEIVAGALQDIEQNGLWLPGEGHALVVGEPSYGKFTFQFVRELKRDGATYGRIQYTGGVWAPGSLPEIPPGTKIMPDRSAKRTVHFRGDVERDEELMAAIAALHELEARYPHATH